MTGMVGTLNNYLMNLWRMFSNHVSDASPPRLTQTIDMQGRFPLAADISKLPGSPGSFT